MKKFFLILLVVLPALLASCSPRTPNPIPYDDLTFEVENNPSYIGSYIVERNNSGQSWYETGEWTPLQGVFQSRVVCFGYWGGDGTFRSRSDYNWIEIEKDGRLCLELQKKTE